MKRSVLWISITIAVVIIYHICYNLTTLVPSNIDWLMTARHDWGTHYLGWAFYKNEPWHFPFGKVIGYNYPVGTNVGFTDSIPLFAIFFKLFAHWLSDDFQYYGIFLFLCHLLAAYYTVLFCRLFKVSDIITFVAAIFIATNPVLVYRGMHPALCAQWLLIACMYFYFLDPQKSGTKKILRAQLLLLLISALINPYLCWMVLGFTLCTPVKLCFFEKTITKKYFFGYVALSVVLLILVWYLVGMIDFGKKEDLAVDYSYGLYALNLNSLFNSSGYSNILPTLNQVSWHQYEGYMYLGFGVMILLFVLLLYILYKKTNKNKSLPETKTQNKNMLPLIVLAALYTIFSITTVLTLNDKVLIRIPAPPFFVSLVQIFRANARFFWLPYYMIILFTIIALAKSKLKPVFVTTMIIVALIIQFYDIHRLLTSRRDITYGTYTPPMDNQQWIKLMSQFDNILFFPAFQSPRIRSMDYQDFSFLALKAGKPINLAYVPRADSRAMQAFSDSLTADIETGKLSPKSLYIISAGYFDHFSVAFQTKSAVLNALDGCFYVLSSSLKNEIVNEVARKGNATAKAKIDSLLHTIGERKEFIETGMIPTKNKESIRYHAESIHVSPIVISASGFAFIDSTQNNSNDSIFVTLSSRDKSYITKAEMFQRPDVNSYFKRTHLENSGFKFLAFTDSVVKGTYQIGLAIKDAAGKFNYQPLSKEVSVKIPEYEVPEKTARVSSVGKINFDLVVDEKNEQFTADGWAAIENHDADSSVIHLVLQNDQNTYICNIRPNLRPDVTASVKNKYNLDNSGYTVKIMKNTLERGKYKIGLSIKNNRRNVEATVMTDKEITVQ